MSQEGQSVELQQIGENNEKPEFEPESNTGEAQASGTAGVEGTDNPAYTPQDDGPPVEDIPPPMTFVDFLPLLLESAESNNDTPMYAEFSTVLEQANQWLKGNPAFKAMKLESIIKKMADRDVVDLDQVVHHESTYGVNKYLRGLRLWLAPRLDSSEPVQEIGYLTTLPEPVDESNAEAVLSMFRPSRFRVGGGVPSYCGMNDMMLQLNKFLKKKPIPGSILNVETVKVKYDDQGSKCLDTEKMCWADCGKEDRIYIYAIRLYYVAGKPAFETLGYHDEIPVCINNWELVSKIRFCPFTQVVQRAKNWLKTQKGIRVVNMQTVEIFSDRTNKGEAKVHHDISGHGEAAGQDTQFARVLRLFFIQDSKSTECTYSALNLTTRLFIPSRHGQWGKNCETFSKTMQRVITWLQLTKTPIFGVETVNYQFSPDSYGTGVRENDASISLVATSGKYFITTVRLYFPCEFEEPDPELLPHEEEDQGWWACTVS
ncbi:uncharacterized protein LOC132749465 [Ruditapes philippinarum]|uniref:uncharacterized protein LOC132749465 n=1 Tax=Ruditapes philippinarum TaxID=129788 RepID=UPI00295BA38C|nr:uncharacterized protein LOC132749465 [Ruditapes philippinarum]XP_060595195.1 uncharacterized protein LOC132749465 [Ruditapes philippinarum]